MFKNRILYKIIPVKTIFNSGRVLLFFFLNLENFIYFSSIRKSLYEDFLMDNVHESIIFTIISITRLKILTLKTLLYLLIHMKRLIIVWRNHPIRSLRKEFAIFLSYGITTFLICNRSRAWGVIDHQLSWESSLAVALGQKA